MPSFIEVVHLYLYQMILSYVLLVSFPLISFGLDNGLGSVPPMGWLSWLRYRCTIDCKKYPNDCISENLIMQMADKMSEGFKNVGYEYVMLDDCWLADKRSSNGTLLPDPDRFPKGIKFLSDYVHSKGLKFGIYEDCGLKTCAGYPGSLGHLETDAKTFASWGVDYLKIDGCWNIPILQPSLIDVFSKFLNSTGHPIFLNVEWPMYIGVKELWPSQIALLKRTTNMARIHGDIDDSWSSLLGVIDFYKENPNNFSSWAGPGYFNDPDMLLIGNNYITAKQEQVQMIMWSIFAAPLIMSNDLRNISESSKSILTNKNVISINQDPMGIQGKYIKTNNGTQLWTRPLLNNRYAIALVNLQNDDSLTYFSLQELGIVGDNNFLLTDVFDPQHQTKVSVNTIVHMPLESTSSLLLLCEKI